MDAVPLHGDTPGTFANYMRRTLFVGDAMDFRGGRLEPAMEFAADDPGENLRSIVGLAASFEDRPLDFTRTAHGGSTPEGRARDLLTDLARRCRQKLEI